MFRQFLVLVLAMTCLSCDWFSDPSPNPRNELPSFSSTPTMVPISPGPLNEASGMVSSLNFPGALWLINDSGNNTDVHLLNADGTYMGNVKLINVTNRDWEDIAMGPGPDEGKNYLYVSNTGDNLEVYSDYSILRFPEPQSLGENINPEPIRFVYSDGKSYDTEALFVDPSSLDLYLVTKRQFYAVRLYRIAYPYSILDENVAEFLGTLPLSSITAADISKNGNEILLKDYNAIFYWKRADGESIEDALLRKRDLSLPYSKEVQGESLCFDSNDMGYFTISEKADSVDPITLNYYARESEAVSTGN
ncbi:PE-PGRS family protein [Marinilongibacter aquaticus]|uniref:PE-PGRS family protein n=1 Tax=Marinilongibacter aquaticus TaxID=2975157 RepID=UPI0021BD4AAE|nr:PE-PGRS family protein [Marinilongibacter aquaticus]UBM57996.1 PE-PGRS family protein [Marinilongibacter aquaticus]